MHSNLFVDPLETITNYNIIYLILKMYHLMLILMSSPWAASMKRGGCKFGGSKTGTVLCPKREAVVRSWYPSSKSQ